MTNIFQRSVRDAVAGGGYVEEKCGKSLAQSAAEIQPEIQFWRM